MSEPTVAVVGAGQSGLLTAAALARAGAPTLLVERLPCPGGQEPEPHVSDRLAREAEDAGVRLLLGALAVRWRDGRLDTLGVDGAQVWPLRCLVIATGTRPATRAALEIGGDRCAGVVPGPAAVHLTESGVLLGHRPLVVGGGGLAAHLADLCLRAGAESVTIVAPGSARLDPPPRVTVREHARVVAVHGRPRVAAASVLTAEGQMRIAADALLLADGRRPMRNVEGAISDRAGVVGCHSRADPKTEEDARAAAAEAAVRALARLGSTSTVEEGPA